MQVLKATNEQKETIESQTTGTHLIRFITDANGNYIVGKEVLTDPKLNHIVELQSLIEIDFNPIIEQL